MARDDSWPGRGRVRDVESGRVTSLAPGRYQLRHAGHGGLAIRPEDALIGQGGIARVLLAYDTHLGREVAIKELVREQGPGGPTEPTEHAVVRFLREARVTGQLEHPGILPVYELGRREDGSLYYTMKVVRGRTLEQALADCEGLGDRLALLEHFVHACNAVAYAHSRGVVHRDLKPQNIMLGEFGETVVLDWGIAKIRYVPDALSDDALFAGGTMHTLDGRAMGTPSYMSPEQASGTHTEIDESTDVWALGVILFELLTGRPPFTGVDSEAVIRAVREAEIPSVRRLAPRAPPELAAICDRALRREQMQRYPNAKLVAEDVGAWQHGGYVRAYDYALTELLWRFARRHQAVLVTTVLSALAMMAIVTVGYRRVVSERDRAVSLESVAASREAELRVSVSEAYAEKARRALEDGELQEAELFAAAALVNGKHPAARGVLLALEGHLRPRLAWHSDPGVGCWDLERVPGRRGLVACSRSGGVVLIDPETSREERRLALHEGEVPALVAVPGFPGGGAMVSGGWDGKVLVWSARSGDVILRIQHPGRVWAVDASPDGTTVASAGDDGVIRLWDLETGVQTGALEASEGPIFGVAFVDRDHLASGGLDGRIRVWDLATGRDQELSGHESGVRTLASGGPAVLLSGGYEGQVIAWRLARGDSRVVAEHEGGVLDVARAADGTVVSAGVDGTVHLDHEGRSQRLVGHDGAVLAVLPGGDGEVYTSGQDGTLRSWDSVAGRERRRASGHDGPVRALARGGPGALVATIGEDHTLRLWDGDSGEERLAVLTEGEVNDIAVSADGGSVITGGADGRMSRVRCTDGAVTSSWVHPGGSVAAVGLFPDGTVLGGTEDGVVARTDGDEIRWARSGHAGAVVDVAVDRHSERAASGGADGTVRIWDAASGRVLRVLGPLGGGVTSVVFSPDGQRLAAGGNDRTVRVWSVDDGSEVGRLDHGDRVGAVTWSADGTLLASSSNDRAVQVWDTERWTQLARIAVPGVTLGVLDFARDTTRLYTAADDGLLRAWDLEIPPYVGVLRVGGPALSVRWQGDALITGTRDGRLVRLDPSTGGSETTQAHDGEIFGLDTSPDGTVLLSAGLDGTLRWWERGPDGLELGASFQSPAGALLSVDLAPDGSLVAVSGAGTITVLERETAEVVVTLRGHEGWVSQARFSPDGRYIATASDDATVRVWRVSDGVEVVRLGGHGSEVLSVDWSRDGELLAGGSFDGRVRVWQASTGTEVSVIEAHEGGVRALRFSPDGRLVTSGYDHDVRLWDPRTATELLRLTGHRGPVTDLALSEDGQMLASASDDGTVRISSLRPRDLAPARRLEQARADFGQVIDGMRVVTDPDQVAVVLRAVDGG